MNRRPKGRPRKFGPRVTTTVRIPLDAWQAASDAGWNFSAMLTEAIEVKLNEAAIASMRKERVGGDAPAK